MKVVLHIVDLICTANGVVRIVKLDRGQLVMGEVTRAKRAEEPHGLDMEDVAVKEILSKAENQIADEAREADR